MRFLCNSPIHLAPTRLNPTATTTRPIDSFDQKEASIWLTELKAAQFAAMTAIESCRLVSVSFAVQY